MEEDGAPAGGQGNMNWDAFAQVAELNKQNRILQEKLESKEREAISLRELVDAQKDLQSENVQGAKVIELSKKIRELTQQQGKDKATIAQLQRDLADARKAAGGPTKFRPGEVQEDPVENLRRDLKTAKDNHNAALERVGKLEAAHRALQQERDKILLALKNELGEDISIDQVLKDLNSGSSNWVGRSQQIVLLKEKVRDLQKAQGLAQDTKVERDNLDRIRKLRADKIETTEKKIQEGEQLRAEIQAMKLKCDSASSRVKILTEDNKDLRSKIQVILDKTANDDRLINALKSQLDVAKRQLKEQGKTMDTDRFVIEELEALRQRSQMQEQQIDRQQAIIVQLQQKLNTAASQPLQPQASGVVRVTGRLPSSANMGGAPVASTSGSRPGSSLLPPKSPAGINQPPAPMSGSRPGSSIRPGSQPRQGNPASRGSGGGISIPSIDGRPPSVTTLPPIESQFMATADDHGGQDESEYSEEEDGVMPGPAMSAEVTTIARDDESL